MELLVFRALWGMTGNLDDQIQRIAEAGYDGIEAFVTSPGVPDAGRLRALVEAHSLKLIMNAPVEARGDLESALKRVAEYQPIKIGLHTGRDSMSRDEGCVFLQDALRIEQQIGIPVMHETHRGRLFFTPWDTAYYLKQFPDLNVLADFSHWVNVCERLPDDQLEALALARRGAIHIHGRVGYEEGPQVPDPSAPEYAGQLAWHEAQWQAIWQARRAAGDTVMTFTPEYGPPKYLHTLPHTNAPVADLWEVCLWAARRAREQFAHFSADAW